MHVVTHLLVGWTVAAHTAKSARDRALITWASVVPDIDGLGLLADWAGGTVNSVGGFYEQFHRVLLHGLPGAIACTLLFACFARDRMMTSLWVFVSYHLHLAGDLLGSRGSGPNDFWPIFYLSPASNALTIEWGGQWPLTSWQNTTLTAALMAYALVLAIRRGYSPVGLFSRKADTRFVEILRAWSRTIRSRA